MPKAMRYNKGFRQGCERAESELKDCPERAQLDGMYARSRFHVIIVFADRAEPASRHYPGSFPAGVGLHRYCRGHLDRTASGRAGC